MAHRDAIKNLPDRELIELVYDKVTTIEHHITGNGSPEAGLLMRMRVAESTLISHEKRLDPQYPVRMAMFKQLVDAKLDTRVTKLESDNTSRKTWNGIALAALLAAILPFIFNLIGGK